MVKATGTTLTPEQQAATALVGRKFDAGKLDYTLVPFEGLDEIVKVLMFGAQKYARDNWRHVDNAKQRYIAAAFRHLTEYNKGNTIDNETGLSHMAHVGCCILFILALEKAHGTDPGGKSKSTRKEDA